MSEFPEVSLVQSKPRLSRATRYVEFPKMTKNTQKVDSSRGSSSERGVPTGVPAGVPAQKEVSSKVPAEGSNAQRGSNKGFQQEFQPGASPCILAHMPLLTPLVN